MGSDKQKPHYKVWVKVPPDEATALTMLDDEDKTPSEVASEEWLGPVDQYTTEELGDEACEVTRG